MSSVLVVQHPWSWPRGRSCRRQSPPRSAPWASPPPRIAGPAHRADRLIPKPAPRSSSKTARSSPAARRLANRWLSSATASAPSSAATPGARSSCASKGHGQSKAELKRIGEALVGPRHPAVRLPPARQRAQRAADDDPSRNASARTRRSTSGFGPAESSGHRKGEMSR